ncbi:DUF3592 domain-containing protein [Streptomyces sp. NPDC093097]|uniref:DUF3592 domain-containing protein n=1 Tax=Streptomyces sp. NPDC093097 TaxID=3366027 RepID=UPI00381D5550
MFGAIALGVLLSAVGLIAAGVSISYLTGAERARGTATGLEWSGGGSIGRRGSSSSPSAHPVVEFTTADGTSRTFRGSAGSSPPAYEVGERVEVLYRADSPGDARINGFIQMWVLPLVMGGLGLGFTGIGTAFALAKRRHARAALSR